MTSTCINMNQTLVYQNVYCNHPRYALNQSSTNTILLHTSKFRFQGWEKRDGDASGHRYTVWDCPRLQFYLYWVAVQAPNIAKDIILQVEHAQVSDQAHAHSITMTQKVIGTCPCSDQDSETIPLLFDLSFCCKLPLTYQGSTRACELCLDRNQSGYRV